MKMLITGASGFLGRKLAKTFSGWGFQTIGTFLTKPAEGLLPLDIRDKQQVDKIIKEQKPDVVINTAGTTNVDACEDNQEACRLLDVVGPANLAGACRDNKARLFHCSTDFIFDGTRTGYTENDAPNPVNAYGLAKLGGEREIGASGADFVIARVAVLYGFSDNTIGKAVQWIHDSLKQGKQLKVVTDQYNCPTLTDDIALAFKTLVEKNRAGVYHVVGSECVSRYELACNVARAFGFDEGLITPVDSNALALKARRPAKACLSIKKLEAEGVKMRATLDGLHEARRQMEERK